MSEQFFFRHHFFLIEIHQHFGGFKLKIKKFQLFLCSKMQHHMVHTNLCYLHFLAHCGGFFHFLIRKSLLSKRAQCLKINQKVS